MVPELDTERADAPALTSWLLRVATFKLFMSNQPSVSHDKSFAKLDKRLDGAATPRGQEVSAQVSALSASSSSVIYRLVFVPAAHHRVAL